MTDNTVLNASANLLVKIIKQHTRICHTSILTVQESDYSSVEGLTRLDRAKFSALHVRRAANMLEFILGFGRSTDELRYETFDIRQMSEVLRQSVENVLADFMNLSIRCTYKLKRASKNITVDRTRLELIIYNILYGCVASPVIDTLRQNNLEIRITETDDDYVFMIKNIDTPPSKYSLSKIIFSDEEDFCDRPFGVTLGTTSLIVARNMAETLNCRIIYKRIKSTDRYHLIIPKYPEAVAANEAVEYKANTYTLAETFSDILMQKQQDYIAIPSFVSIALDTLTKSGFEAYAVGGCVRDSLMGKTPSDWDITTSALPQDTKKLFSQYKTFNTGISHGTITVVIEGHNVEITTFRIDGEYSDNRRPDKVTFTPSLAEDLARRDFTINAMAYNPEIGIIDLYGGKADLNNKIIRCVGDAKKRFREDALRIMRALRFAAVCSFEIEPQSAAALVSLAPLLENISAERISSELKKLLTAPGCAHILKEYSLVFSQILPEITFSDEKRERIKDSKPILEIRLAHLLYPMPRVSQALKKLRFDNKTARRVKILTELYPTKLPTTKTEIKKLLNSVGKEVFSMLLEIKNADKSVRRLYDEIICNNECYSLDTLAIDGSDLIEKYNLRGKEIGNALDYLLHLVIEGRCENEKESLLEAFKKQGVS